MAKLDPNRLRALLAAIEKNSSEDAPYLVLADWLPTQGHPWGRLIALNIALEKTEEKDELLSDIQAFLDSSGVLFLGATLGGKLRASVENQLLCLSFHASNQYGDTHLPPRSPNGNSQPS